MNAARDLPHPRAAASIALDLPLTIGWGRRGLETRPLCRGCCRSLVPWVEPARIAGTPLTVWPAFETDDCLLSVIHALKFSRRERLASWLAGSLVRGLPARALSDHGDDIVLVPVPMDRGALRRRGFNQAERLASTWGEIAGVRVERRALVKTRATAPQSSLGREERVRNVVGAIEIGDRDAVAGKRVVLVDDLVTTGATASTCAAALGSAGACEVRVACVGYRP